MFKSATSAIRTFVFHTPSRFADSPAKSSLFSTYKAVVLAGAFYGMCKGVNNYAYWYDKERTKVYVTYKPIEPIVNASVDVAHLGFHLFWTGLISGLVTATAPISVPLIMHLMPDTPPTKEKDDNKKDSIEQSLKAIDLTSPNKK